MKFVFLSFGLVGFGVAVLGGWLAGRQPDLVLRDAALAALAAAVLGRWFWGRLEQAARDAVRERQQQAEAEREAARQKSANVAPAVPTAAVSPRGRGARPNFSSSREPAIKS